MKQIGSELSGKVLLLFLCKIFLQINLLSQNADTPAATWLLPGISFQKEEKLRIQGQAGRNLNQNIDAIYFQVFLKANKTITVNPAYLFLDYSIPGSRSVKEHTLMNSVILSLKIKSWILENRNLFWNRFRTDLEDLHFYRNRLRIIKPFSWKARSIRIYAFDEGWLFLNDLGWTRNRIGAGLACDVQQWFSMDLSFLRQHDRNSGAINLIFLMGTVQFFQKKR